MDTRDTPARLPSPVFTTRTGMTTRTSLGAVNEGENDTQGVLPDTVTNPPGRTPSVQLVQSAGVVPKFVPA
jgi:hypothetical protein